MVNRIPPQNIDAERSIIGGLLVEPETSDSILEDISPEDFYNTSHKKIYKVIQGLQKKSQPIDLVTVSNALKDSGELDEVGGAAYLAEMVNETPLSGNIESYAKIVKEKSILRKLISVSQSIAGKAYDMDFEDIESFLDHAETEVFKVAEERDTQGLVPVSEIVSSSVKRIEDLYEKKIDITGISTGFSDLDRLTAGFQPGEMIIVAARPSMGKTAFSLNLATHAALKEKKNVAFFSVEMSKETLMLRLLALESEISMSDMRVGKVPDKSWTKLIDVASKLSGIQLYIDDSSGVSPYEIRAKCRRLKKQQGLDMIIVDYLQIMDLKQKVESRERAVSEMSRMLKAIAKELNVPIIALAQLNRGVEGRTDRRPLLSDLRESGSIEQDADVIMMLYREDYYEKGNNNGIAEVIINKQRNGPVGTVKLAWSAQYGRFSNLAPASYAPPPVKEKGNNKSPIPNFAPPSS